MAYTDNRHTIVELITGVVGEVSNLFQTEMRLVRTELNEKAERLANGGVLIGAGAVIALGAFFLLLLAVVRWLVVAGLPEEWGLLLVGLLAAAIGGLLISRGLQAIKPANLVPDRSIGQVRAGFSTVKEHVR